MNAFPWHRIVAACHARLEVDDASVRRNTFELAERVPPDAVEAERARDTTALVSSTSRTQSRASRRYDSKSVVAEGWGRIRSIPRPVMTSPRRKRVMCLMVHLKARFGPKLRALPRTSIASRRSTLARRETRIATPRHERSGQPTRPHGRSSSRSARDHEIQGPRRPFEACHARLFLAKRARPNSRTKDTPPANRQGSNDSPALQRSP